MLSMSLAFLYSCSSDSDTTPSTEPVSGRNDGFHLKGGSPTDSLYNVMINSTSYSVAESSLSQFLSKMNFTGSLSEFDTEAKMLSWINTNISTTTFGSYAAAVSEWEGVTSSGEDALVENIAFYVSLAAEEDPDRYLFDLIYTEPEAPTSDPCGCLAAFNYQSGLINARYTAGVKAALDAYRSSGASNRVEKLNKTLNLLRAQKDYALKFQSRLLVQCVEGCTE